MQDFNELIPLAALAIPMLVAFLVAPTGTNRQRALLSVVLSAALPALSMAVERDITEPKTLALEFLTALVAQFTSYGVAKGVAPDLNQSLGSQGLGRIEIDV